MICPGSSIAKKLNIEARGRDEGEQMLEPANDSGGRE